jgi:3-keto-disaccharide hydrolase
MLRKNIMAAAALLLVAATAVIAGASQFVGQQEPPAQVVQPAGAVTDAGLTAPAVPVAPALPAAVGKVAFSDTFDGAKLEGWRTLPEAEGRWAAHDGRLQQWGLADSEQADNPTVLIAGNTDAGDGVFEAQVFPTSGAPVGVVFRGSDAGYYRLTLLMGQQGFTENLARLERVEKGNATQLAVSNNWAGFKIGAWQRVEVNMSGSRIVVSVDGQQLFDVADSALSSGWIGVWTWADRGADFDNVRVQSAPAGR